MVREIKTTKKLLQLMRSVVEKSEVAEFQNTISKLLGNSLLGSRHIIKQEITKKPLI